MTTQHIPTAFPSDTELLNALQAAKREGRLWVYRSAGAYGATLHEVLPIVARQYNWKAYPDVREAIAVGLGLVKKET